MCSVESVESTVVIAPMDGKAVLCPLCEYDLRGLVEPRCPECGYRFVWAELLDTSQNKHPYLFEHYPRNNVWSFFRTAVEGFKPSSFWRTITPQMTPQPRRLLLYWIFCVASPALLGGLLLAALATARSIYPPTVGYTTGIWIPPLPTGSPQPAFVEQLYRLSTIAPGLLIASGLLFFWTSCTHLSLLIFQQSLAKAKIRSCHVSRCVRYSFDIGIWFAVLGVVSLLLEYLLSGRDSGLFLVLLGGPLLLMAIVRLWCSYQLYLKFDRAFWVVTSSQIISGLAMMLLLVTAYNLRWLRF